MSRAPFRNQEQRDAADEAEQAEYDRLSDLIEAERMKEWADDGFEPAKYVRHGITLHVEVLQRMAAARQDE